MLIQWFPGHMTKAIRLMEANLRLVDALIYVIDARAVASCINPVFDRLLAGKRALYVFNKCDLVEAEDIAGWCDRFKREGKAYVKAVGTSGDCSQIAAGLRQLMADKIEKYSKKGANISVRAMVVGVPNSGKSTIINAMLKRAKAVTGDRPGVTRGTQWLSVDGIDFLDTPGTLWSKFEDQKVAHHLAYIGSIKDDVLDCEQLAFDFIDEVKYLYPDCFKLRYGIGDSEDTLEIFDAIAAARGYRLKGGEPDYDRTARMIIDEFRKGKLGKLSLEKAQN